MATHARLLSMPLPRHKGNVNWAPKGIQMSEYFRCPLGCAEVLLSCTYHRQPSLFSDEPSYLPTASKFCRSACSCEKDFSMKVKNEMLSLFTVYGCRKDPTFSNSVCHPSVEEMIECATVCYWTLKVEQLKDSRTQFVPKKDNTRILPRCFHRTLRGITAIASERRLVKDKEIK
jgi:hypothetical protein